MNELERLQLRVATLEEENSRLRDTLDAILDHTPANIYWHDRDGTILGCNQRQAETLGYNCPEDIIGHHPGEFLNQKDSDYLMEIISQIVEQQKEQVFEENVSLIHGEKVFLSTKVPFKEGIMGVSIDITERKKREQELQETKDKMVKTAVQLAHDIRSPASALNAIACQTEDLPQQQRQLIRNAAQRINDIANNLLAEYKQPEGQQTQGKPQGHIEPCLIYPIIDQVVSEKRQVLDNNQSLEFEVADRQAMMCYAKVNRAKLARVISNLVNNALEATDSAEGLIQITLAINNDHLMITITDNGPGMSEKQLQQVLNPAQTTQSTKAQGHGIGIAHAQETLKRLGAEFDMQSTLGEGTTAELILKAIQPPLWMARELTVYPQDTVIILDDDPTMHDAWRRFLAHYQDWLGEVGIQHFTGAQACIEAINQLNQPYQTLLLADYELMKQSMNGLDVVQATQLPRSVLVTSHYNNDDIIKRAILLGTYVLPKELSVSVQLAVQDEPLTPPQVKPADLVLLEDNKAFADSIDFLYKRRGQGSHLTNYYTPYELIYHLPCYSKDTAICLDFQYDCPYTGMTLPVNGLDMAYVLHQQGFTKLYLATGFKMHPENMPAYVQLAEDKMDITYL